MNEEKQYLTYEEFGAIGNGIADDMPYLLGSNKFGDYRSRLFSKKDWQCVEE